MNDMDDQFRLRSQLKSRWGRRVIFFGIGFVLAVILILKFKNFFLLSEPQGFSVAGKMVKSHSRFKAQGPTPGLAKREDHNLKLSMKNVDDSEGPIENFVRMESLKIGHPDPDPQQSYKRLLAVAKNLKKKDMDLLKNISLDKTNNNDQRFLGVYLLALSESSDAAPMLMDIASDQMDHDMDTSTSSYAEELMIRTQALEGLAKLDSGGEENKSGGWLQQVLLHQDNSFLAHQAQRLLAERQRAKKTQRR